VDWPRKVTTLLRSIHQTISILNTKVEAPAISLRLFLLAAQVADECGFEELTYEFYVQAFSVYEESISDSRAQLQAIATIIGTLQGATVFGNDNYDTLSTKAALHAAKLLKKPHQSTAVQIASHLWWQGKPAVPPAEPSETAPDDGLVISEEKKVCVFINHLSLHFIIRNLSADGRWEACVRMLTKVLASCWFQFRGNH
jgi:vacuolar protein sorting-associated protein 35